MCFCPLLLSNQINWEAVFWLLGGTGGETCSGKCNYHDSNKKQQPGGELVRLAHRTALFGVAECCHGNMAFISELCCR